MKEFTDEDEQALMVLLDEMAGDDTLDYAATHGLLCAIVAGPEVAQEDWLATVFDGEPDFEDPVQARRCIELLGLLHADLAHRFYGNDRVRLPCPLRPGHERLESWCVGFMEGIFLREEDWRGEDADPEVTHLLMPVMVESGLIDAPEIEEIRRNRGLRETMVRELPENLTDLYLLFHGGKAGDEPQP